ncbi:MAG: GRP family sugar transporter [Nanoarchaeota archaeon]
MLSISIIVGLIAMFSWGIADFLQSVAIRKMGTYKVMFLSNIFGLLMTFPVLFFIMPQIALSNMLLLLLGGIMQTAAIYFFYTSMKKGDISLVAPISASYPIVTILLLRIFVGQTISIITLIAILMLIFGIVLTSTDLKKIRQMHTVAGVKESLITLMLWGIYFFVLKIVSDNITLFGINFPETHYLSIFFFSNIAMGIFMMLFSVSNKGIPTKKDLKDKTVLLILFSTSVIFTLAWIILTYGFTIGDASIITPISSLYPVIIVMLAMIFYKEKLVLNQKLGILTILAGLVLISL